MVIFRIIGMRTALRDGLAKEGSSHNWQHITDQVLHKMFFYAYQAKLHFSDIPDWHVLLHWYDP